MNSTFIEFDAHSQDFVFTIIQVLSVGGTLTNLFGLYTILRHSPKEMGEYARALAALQVTTTCCDHITADGASPYLLFPLIGGVEFGWMTWIGISTEILTVLEFSVIGHTQTCTMMLFFLRLQFIAPDDHSLKIGKGARSWFFLFLHVAPYIHCCWYLTMILNWEPKQTTNDVYLKIYPQLRQFIMMPRFLGFARGSHTFFLVNILGFLAVCGSFMIGCSFLCFYFLRLQENFLEKRLVDEERQLIKALIIQVTIPMVTVIIPFCLGAIVIFVDNTELTMFCPLIGLLFAQHGLCNTIAILCLYRPYREHVKRTFRRITELSSFQKCFTPPSIPIIVIIPSLNSTSTSK